MNDLVLHLMAIWKEHMRPRNAHDDHVLRCLQAQSMIQEVLSKNAAWAILKPDDVTKLQTNVRRLLQEYTVLANAADRNDDLLFITIPKHHYLYHLSDHGRFVNPRKGNCTLDEDCMEKVNKVVASSVSGTKSCDAPRKVALKYRAGMQFVLNSSK